MLPVLLLSSFGIGTALFLLLGYSIIIIRGRKVDFLAFIATFLLLGVSVTLARQTLGR